MSQALVARAEQDRLELVALVDSEPLDLDSEVFELESELFGSVFEAWVPVGSLGFSGGAGCGPPAGGLPPVPPTIGGFQPQQRPQLRLLPGVDLQNIGIRQPPPPPPPPGRSQRGPVHIQAPVGLMSPELVNVEM